MTLKEKFKIPIDANNKINNYVAEQCEEIADEFAIGLLYFIEGTYSYSNIFDYWYLHADTSKTFTKNKLVEIYKKEKGL